MKIEEPEIYFGKKIKVTSTNGRTHVGEFYGYDYDYDDAGNEFLEFDIETQDGTLIGYTEDEVESVEVL